MADAISHRGQSFTSNSLSLAEDNCGKPVSLNPSNIDEGVVSRNGMETDSLNSNNSNRKANGTTSTASSILDYEKRIRKLKAKEAADYEKKKEQLMISQQRADEARRRLVQERRRQIEENKRRETERRKQVQARRLELDKAKLEKFDRMVEKANIQRDKSNQRPATANLMTTSCYGGWSRPQTARNCGSRGPAFSIAFGTNVSRPTCTLSDPVAAKRQRELEDRLSRFMNSRHKGCFASSHDPELRCLMKICEERSRSKEPSHSHHRAPRSKSSHAQFMRATKASLLRARCMDQISVPSDDSSVRSNTYKPPKVTPIASDSRLITHTMASKARMRTASVVEPVQSASESAKLAKKPACKAKPEPKAVVKGLIQKATANCDSGLANSLSDSKPSCSPDEDDKTASALESQLHEPLACATENVAQLEAQTTSSSFDSEHALLNTHNNSIELSTASANVISSLVDPSAEVVVTTADSLEDASSHECQDDSQKKSNLTSQENSNALSETTEESRSTDWNKPLNAESHSAGEGAALTGDAAVIYKARLEEQRRLAREKIEQQKKLERERAEELAKKKAEVRAEQLRRAQAKQEEENRREQERRRQELEMQEKQRLDRLQEEEQERKDRREKLLSIKRKVGLQSSGEGNNASADEASSPRPAPSPSKTFLAGNVDLRDPNSGVPKFQSALLQRMLDKGRLNPTPDRSESAADLTEGGSEVLNGQPV